MSNIQVNKNIQDFCCEGFGWRVFAIQINAVYTECDNPNCQKKRVFLEELGDIERLEEWIGKEERG